MENKVSEVKAYFEDSTKYLGEDGKTIGIMSRQKIIQGMLSGKKFKNLLDVPCGNGLVSLPLLDQADQLTLIDIAESMVNLAKQNFSEDSSPKVKILQGNIFEMDLIPKSYDCILAIGILAHVDDPSAFINRISTLLKPGGTLIIQSTDHGHFKIRLQKSLKRNKNLNQEGKYTLNTINHSWLLDFIKNKGYDLINLYRYETKAPIFLPGKGEEGLKAIWKIYGTPPKNRLGFLGSKCIYHFKKK